MKQDVNNITAELTKLDRHYMEEFAAITESESLVPAAKKRRLEQKQQEYQAAWNQKKREVEERLQARGEELYRTAFPPEKLPSDPQKAMLVELKRSRVRDQASRLAGKDGLLLAAYKKALRQGDSDAAREFEEVLGDGDILTTKEAKEEFNELSRKEQDLRLSDSERRAREQLEEYHREHESAAQGLALQEQVRHNGYRPEIPDSTLLATSASKSGTGEAEVSEIRRRRELPSGPLPTERPSWIEGEDGHLWTGNRLPSP
jgi:hypothetical protein